MYIHTSRTGKNFIAGVGAGTIESIFGASVAFYALDHMHTYTTALSSNPQTKCMRTPTPTPLPANHPTPKPTPPNPAVVTPVETVKTKLIHLNMEFIGGVKHIIAKEGLGGVYQGLGATIMKQVRM